MEHRRNSDAVVAAAMIETMAEDDEEEEVTAIFFGTDTSPLIDIPVYLILLKGVESMNPDLSVCPSSAPPAHGICS